MAVSVGSGTGIEIEVMGAQILATVDAVVVNFTLRQGHGDSPVCE
jgi:hypothetical protein